MQLQESKCAVCISIFLICYEKICFNNSLLDPNYLAAFLLTYRAFATPQQLLNELIERFNVEVPEDAPEGIEFLEYFHSNYRQPIHIRLLYFNNYQSLNINIFIKTELEKL